MRKIIISAILSFFILSSSGYSDTDAQWQPIQKIEFSKDELPLNLYSLFTGKEKNSFIQYCLPANYSTDKKYPLILYVPGFHGKPGGNIKNAKDIANSHECIVASLPLFKETIDRSEVADGVIVSVCDYPTLSKAYGVMLERLFEAVPNIDKSKSSMVGFSNGAITIAILLTAHDSFILDHFQSFCMVDHGMFHLTDLHKTPTKNKRFLIMVGDKEDLGRDLKLRGAKLVEDSYRLLNINVESRILENTGHELTTDCKADIGKWIFQDTKSEQED